MFFPEAFASIKSHWFWYIGIIDNSLGVTWKFCPRNFKNSDTDCTISQKKSHSELQKKKEKKAMLLLYDYVKNYDLENLKHSKMNDKNVSTS